MNKICTSIEQSKKLIELGIDVNTADMIHNILGEPYVKHDTPIDQYHTPAWSLSALIELMPITCVLSISNGHYRIASNETNTLFHNNPLDASFEMICWLLKNKKI